MRAVQRESTRAARTWRRRMCGLALSLWFGVLGSCVPPEDGPTPGHSHLGSWVASQTGECTESLTFSADGRYRYRMAVQMEGAAAIRQMAGTTTDTQRLADGSLALTLVPDNPWADALPGICADWRRSTRVELSFESLATITGVDPAALRYRSVPMPDGGRAWVGSDPLLEMDRFALVQDGAQLRGFPLENWPIGGPALFHRPPLELPSRLSPGSPIPLVNLPQQAWQDWVATSPVGASLGKLLISLHSATQVSFSVRPVGAEYPLCDLVVWDSYDYQQLLVPNPLADVVDGTVLTLNPLDPEAPLVSVARTAGGDTETVYLLPLEIRAPAPAGACELNIRGHPVVGALVQSHLAEVSVEADPLRLSLPESDAYLLAHARPSTPGLSPLPVDGLAAVGEGLLTGQLVLPAVADPVLLNPPDGGPRAARQSVSEDQGRAQLSVYAEGRGAAGVGPFHRPRPNPPDAILEPGLSHAVSQAPGDPPTRLRISLVDPALLSLFGSGGVRTSARLLDGNGTPLAVAHGGAADGAPDGEGFRIVMALEPGAYVLAVQGMSLPAIFTVSLNLLDSRGPLDWVLEACLRAAAPETAPAASLRAADCTAYPVTSLEGIGAYPGLQHLRLDGSGALNLVPLTALPQLGHLSLAHTRITDLSALGGLGALHTLSLAGVTVDADGLAVLGSLGSHLTLLDLRDVQGVTEEDIASLAGALPNTQIVASDGAGPP